MRTNPVLASSLSVSRISTTIFPLTLGSPRTRRFAHRPTMGTTFRGVGEELVDEPGLADAGLAEDHGFPALPPPRRLPGLAQPAELRVATDERGVARRYDVTDAP